MAGRGAGGELGGGSDCVSVCVCLSVYVMRSAVGFYTLLGACVASAAGWVKPPFLVGV